MGMIIENSGILTTVQDGGRFGYEQFGVSPSGPMDLRALHIANILTGNDMEEACLEMTVMGPVIRFTGCAVIAVTGADMKPKLNEKPMCMYRAVSVKAGDVLKFGMVQKGCRSYLSVAGGMRIPELMGSKSTMVGKGFGGYEGRKLQKDDEITFVKSISMLPNMQVRWVLPEPCRNGEHVLRVIMGPQDDMFTQKGIDSFLGGAYKVGQEFDRMGYRLEGPVIEHKDDGNIISDGIVTGSIQVPTAGQPIVMLAERQTVGGYTKIATVITVDLPVIGQCKAGDVIRFRAVTVEEAQELYEAYYQEMEALQKKMVTPVNYLPPRSYTICIGEKVYQVQVEERED
ncbi:MAG: biotin-dependent carboxyltransferase family protein [Clostridiales bacterium]|nr:biotin-dependent carboxyltransferase family protein [Clostridiales bacterium]